jgi:hypothetical protein
VDGGVLGGFVAFVADEDEGEGGVAASFGLFEPFANVLKTAAVADVEDEDCSHRVAIVPPA